MKLTRREFVQSAAAGLALAGTSGRMAFASDTFDLGGMQIRTISDGYLTLPGDFIFGPMPKDELAPILERHGVAPGPQKSPVNVTLVRDGDRTILFDTGSGPSFQQTSGLLAEALDAAGVAPEDVTHVVFTHCHPDHLWGVLDDFDDPFFYEAEHMMGRTEWDYWFNPETVNTIQPERTTMAAGARRRMEVLEEAMTLFDDGDEILPGVAARASFGHTPGHMSFELRQGSDSVMIVGDAFTNAHVAFERPDWHSGSDQDQDLAATTRTGLLDQIATENMRLIGYHLPEGGIGRAERSGDGYTFIPGSA